jgi:hypothetical protein
VLHDLIEEKFASERIQQEVRGLEEKSRLTIDKESRELLLVAHALAIAAEAGQIFRPTIQADWGIVGEIEFKNDQGEPSGRRVYLQFKSDEYFTLSKQGERLVFTIGKEDYAEQWRASVHPVMLVVRDGYGRILWMNVTEYLQTQGKAVKQIVFEGEPFTAQSLWRMRDRVLMSEQ